MAYANHQDAKEYLDIEAFESRYRDINILIMQQFIEVAEQQFDGRLRRHINVPVGEADSPEAFAIAKEVCAKRAAASYLRWAYSAEGTADHTWWADELDKMAEELIVLLETRRQPTDTEDPTDPIIYIPYDGGPTRPAVFKREHAISGSAHW